jgi:hypothetical protein
MGHGLRQLLLALGRDRLVEGVRRIMIKVFFSPQRADNQIEYSFCGETVTARIGEAENTFDFSALPDGELNIEESIETTLPVCPIISAKRVDGILHLELLNWIEPDAPYESRFPEWCELPLPERITKEKPERTAIIPWRTKQEIEAERAVRLAAEQERAERRARIKDGLTTAKTADELRALLKDMAVELGLR